MYAVIMGKILYLYCAKQRPAMTRGVLSAYSYLLLLQLIVTYTLKGCHKRCLEWFTVDSKWNMCWFTRMKHHQQCPKNRLLLLSGVQRLVTGVVRSKEKLTRYLFISLWFVCTVWRPLVPLLYLHFKEQLKYLF